RETGRIQRVCQPYPGVALWSFGAQSAGAEKPRRQEGAVRGTDRREYALRAGRDRLRQQSAGRGPAEETRLPAKNRRLALPGHFQVRREPEPFPDGSELTHQGQIRMDSNIARVTRRPSVCNTGR